MTNPFRSRHRFYNLVGTIAVPCEFQDVKWDSRMVWKDQIGRVRISTVFLGIDHAFEGPPLLFETMAFGGRHDQDCDRYETWAEAVEGHARWVAREEQERAERLARTDKEAKETR